MRGQTKPPKKAPPVENDIDLPASVLASHIKKLSEVGEALNKSGLRQTTIVLLLHDMTGVGKTDIKYILNALPELARTYTK